MSPHVLAIFSSFPHRSSCPSLPCCDSLTTFLGMLAMDSTYLGLCGSGDNSHKPGFLEQTLNGRLCAGSLLEKPLGEHEGSRIRQSWTVLHSQQRPQPISQKLWRWETPLELDWKEAVGPGFYIFAAASHWAGAGPGRLHALGRSLSSAERFPWLLSAANTQSSWGMSPKGRSSSRHNTHHTV